MKAARKFAILLACLVLASGVSVVAMGQKSSRKRYKKIEVVQAGSYPLQDLHARDQFELAFKKAGIRLSLIRACRFAVFVLKADLPRARQITKVLHSKNSGITVCWDNSNRFYYLVEK